MLKTVDATPCMKFEEGWKVFTTSPFKNTVRNYVRYSAHIRKVSADKKRGGQNIIHLPVGIWIEDRSQKTISGCYWPQSYKTGFHIIVDSTKDEVINAYNPDDDNTIRRVFFKNVVASGTQIGLKTVVAREMFICPQGSEWEDDLPEYMKG